MEKWDVLIVGAGPAGSTAARIIAEKGIKVLVLEKKQKIGVPNHCGEGITYRVLKSLGMNDKKPWIVRKVKGGRLLFPNNTTIYFPETGFCIDRPLFDQELANIASEKGAKILLQKEVIKLIREQEGWRVFTKDGSVYFTNYLVAADGALSTVRRLLGISVNYITAIQYKFPPIERFKDDYLLFYHHQDFYPGYAWVFYRGKETSIGLGTIHNVREKLHKFLNYLKVAPENRISVQTGKIPFDKRPQKIVMPRVLFCGDAGGFLFPFTKGGVRGAIFSGKIAGEVIVEAIKEKKPETLYEYPRRVKIFPSRSRIHLLLPYAFFRLTNESINAIGSVMNKKIYTTIPFFEVVKYLLNKPKFSIAYGFLIGFFVQRLYWHRREFAW